MQSNQHEPISDICVGRPEPTTWEIIFSETFTDSFITNHIHISDTV